LTTDRTQIHRTDSGAAPQVRHPGLLFRTGEHLGTVDAAGNVKLSPTAGISKKVLEAGHMIANHSYSHPVLPKLDEDSGDPKSTAPTCFSPP